MPQPSFRPSLTHRSRLAAMGSIVVLVATIVSATTSTGAAQGSGQGTGGSDVRPMVLGVSMQPDRSQAVYDGFVEQVGRPPAIWSLWSDWGNIDATGCTGGPTSLPPDPAFMAHLHDRRGLFIWQPVDSQQIDSPRFAYDEITKGTFDCYLKSFAQAIGSIPGPVLIRFAHEFDGYWFPRGIGQLTNAGDLHGSMAAHLGHLPRSRWPGAQRPLHLEPARRLVGPEDERSPLAG